jgi:hypothetical protein
LKTQKQQLARETHQIKLVEREKLCAQREDARHISEGEAESAQSTSIVVSEKKIENNYAHLKKSTTTNKTSSRNEPNSSWQLRIYTNMSRGTHLALARKNENSNFLR